ncbi:MAG: hypothetical protein M1818_004601 [Claussenomyces sp. TS43310]|nr:MAG: hypothetical protein M1818_004601 [Claussenomyces sp. TS43310]
MADDELEGSHGPPHDPSSPHREGRGGGSGSSRAGKRGGGGRRSGGGPSRGELGRDVMVSKALSKILRHDAAKEGLRLDGQGYARVDEVLSCNRLKSLKVTFADIQTAVSDNAKQRFGLKPDPNLNPPPSLDSSSPADWMIRANQGHSIALESAALLAPITLEANNLPGTVVHGTYYAFYDAIVASGGLKKMGRNHIHFSTGLPDGANRVVSGMRADAEILFYVDVRRSLEDGAAQWWISDNGVVLSEGGETGMVGPRYWKKVVGRSQDVGVLWEDGREVAELPQNVRGKRAPNDKVARGRKEGDKQGQGRGAGRGAKGGGRTKVMDALSKEGDLGGRGDD